MIMCLDVIVTTVFYSNGIFNTQVKYEVQVKTARKYVNFDAIAYRSQVVAGTNYFIKVVISG